LQAKPTNEEPEAVEFDEKKLKLICVQFISWAKHVQTKIFNYT
jgi:hypothetical protein